MHGYRVSIYICMCMPTRSRAVRLIERSPRLDIFPFHLKFTTGWIFLRPIFSHRNRVTFFEAADHRAKSRQIARLLSEIWLTWEIESSFRKILFSLSSPRHSLSLESYIRNEFLLLSSLRSIVLSLRFLSWDRGRRIKHARLSRRELRSSLEPVS